MSIHTLASNDKTQYNSVLSWTDWLTWAPEFKPWWLGLLLGGVADLGHSGSNLSNTSNLHNKYNEYDDFFSKLTSSVIMYPFECEHTEVVSLGARVQI